MSLSVASIGGVEGILDLPHIPGRFLTLRGMPFHFLPSPNPHALLKLGLHTRLEGRGQPVVVGDEHEYGGI